MPADINLLLYLNPKPMTTPAHHQMLDNLKPYCEAQKITSQKDWEFITDLLKWKRLDRLRQVTPAQAARLKRIHFRYCGEMPTRYTHEDILNGTPDDVANLMRRKHAAKPRPKLDTEGMRKFAQINGALRAPKAK